MQFDEVFKKHIGELGRFQLMVVAICSIEEFIIGFQIMSPVFTAATPDFRCNEQSDNATVNCTGEFKLTEFSKCMYLAENMTFGNQNVCDAHVVDQLRESAVLKDCHNWDYDTSVFGNTMVTEWDLVCDRAWVTKAVASSYLAGMTIGSVLFGWLADRFGRKSISLFSGIPNVIVGIILSFLPEFYSLISLRFVHGVLSAGKTSISFVIAMEFIGPSKRVAVGSCYMIVWALGYVTVGGICYLLRSWRTVMWVIALPEIVYYILLYFLVPESPRWLYLQGRKQEADKIMRKIAKFNHVRMPDDLEIIKENEPPKISLTQLIKTPEIRKVTVIVGLIWIVNGMTYYGISLNSNALSGNPYVNFSLLGAIEVPAYLYLWFVFAYFGRLWPFAGSMLAAGIPLLLILGIRSVSTVLATIAKFFITATFTMLYLYTAEVYPTSLRSTGLCLHATLTRISSSLTPYVTLLDVFHPCISIVIFSTLAILGGVLVLLLPETKDKPLVQTVEEAELQMAQSHLKLGNFKWSKNTKLRLPQNCDDDTNTITDHLPLQLKEQNI